MSKATIVVVAKAPQVGSVKTRLCPPLTYAQAARLYTGFLLDTVETALSLPNVTVKAVCPTLSDANQLSQLLPSSVSYIVQTQAGLTAALTTAFEQALAAGFHHVFCISSDNPTLPVSYLQTALAHLSNDQTDLVLGPSEDGGYYLIGAKAVHPQLFEGMVWSTATVLAETLERARAAGLCSVLLPPWYDLDTGVELSRFVAELSQTEPDKQTALYTRPLLVELGLLRQDGD